MHLGKKDFVEHTKSIIQTTRTLEEALRKIPEIEVMGTPQISVIGIQSKDSSKLNIFNLYDELKKKGWELSSLQRPDSFHICITQVHASQFNFVQMFIQDIREGIEKVMKDSPTSLGKTAKIYCGTQEIPREYADEFLIHYLNIVGQTEAKLLKK